MRPRPFVGPIARTAESIPGTSWAHPDGAFYILANLPVPDAEHFYRWLLQEYSYRGETVMLAPGDGFYVTPGLGKQEVRIAYVLGDADLRRAMNILKLALAEYPYTLTI
ncbi:MAG: hypothetical protein PHY34_04010 [Patescibacteria group bacterium]|nr:hypothetical protein [Patescibacteria group bacterium]MDD5715509.1 hypothetical protein [Patescibacteria group bacterium]